MVLRLVLLGFSLNNMLRVDAPAVMTDMVKLLWIAAMHEDEQQAVDPCGYPTFADDLGLDDGVAIVGVMTEPPPASVRLDNGPPRNLSPQAARVR
jgi:hypothetical protein